LALHPGFDTEAADKEKVDNENKEMAKAAGVDEK
jgi:hypothetical protein